MTMHLSFKQKHEWLPILIRYYGGFLCFYCKNKLDIHTVIFDHLNNNRQDNRIENIVPCCHSCNNKKPHSIEMQVIAIEQLAKNEKHNFVRERKSGNETKEPATEIEINQSNFEIVEQFISEHVSADGYIELTDALNSCVYLCKKKTNHGSQQSVRNYINTLTCSVAPYQITKNEDKKKIIEKRVGA